MPKRPFEWVMRIRSETWDKLKERTEISLDG